MKQRYITPSILLAGLMAVAGVTQAQTTSNVPLRAGEASTMTQGRPNLETNTRSTGAAPTRDTAAPITPDRPNVNRVPGGAGEASTMVRGQPNAVPNNPLLNKTPAEIRAEKEMKRAERQARRDAAVMSQRSAHAGAPAEMPVNSPAGNPLPPRGTPK